MDWYRILNKYACRAGINERGKSDVLSKIAEIATTSMENGQIDKETVYEALKKREEQSTTAFGNKIAVPHATIQGLNNFMVFIVSSKQGVNFDSIDGKKVHLLFVVLAPVGHENEHLKILAAISRITHIPGLLNELIKSDSNVALYESFLRGAWSHESAPVSSQKMKAMFIVLYLEDLIYDILELFIEEDIDGATVIDSFGMGEYISNVPLLATFMGFMNRNKHNSKTVFALVPDHKVGVIVKEIERITGDLNVQEGAMVFTVNVDFFKGSMKMI
jgi:nitrogen PTS system EIIA component